MKKQLLFLVMFISVFGILSQGAAASGKVEESYPVSQGVKYSKYTYGSKNNSMNHLAVDLTNPFTSLSVSIPTPINTMMTTTAHANKNSKEGYRVVGAINANFYNMSDGYPLYLLTENNRILTPDVISSSSSYYVNMPYAFGITKSGNAEIGYYSADIVVDYNGKRNKIDGFNVKREENEAIVYTPTHHSSRTPTNKNGMEFVIETSETINATRFGSTYTGKVTKIRQHGDETASVIPRNGFVLSFNGSSWGDKYRNIQIGDEVSVTFSINDVWQDAQYMMTSGPLLVLDGKKNISMDTSSSRASQVTARSAIAISKDKKTVHLVTVDKSSGKGMSLSQFADYLVTLGVDRAINLDGGGSTTMGIRKYGSNDVVLANVPSDGAQRRVSGIIQAVSTAPTGLSKTISVRRDKLGTMLVGSTVGITPQYVLDEHYNPITIKPENLKVTSENNKVTINGLQYTAKAAGTDRVIVSYGKAAQALTVNIVDAPSSLTMSGTTTLEPNTNSQLTVTPKMADGSELIHDASSVKWSIDGDIGTISSNGVFRSTGKIGKANVTATLGTKSVTKQIEVKESFTGDVFTIDSFEALSNVQSATALATASIALDKGYFKLDKQSLKLTYDMTGNETGTAAAYVHFKEPVMMPSKPKKIGVWVFGNKGKTWVRGVVRDADGQKHTIDFTANAGQTWSGWKYVEAAVPNTTAFPLAMETVYVVQPSVDLQNKGTLYFDKLQAVYSDKYVEPIFSDVSNNHAYKTEIQYLVARELISGYTDGTFKPDANLTRAHAAVLIARALQLDTKNVVDPAFVDVPPTHPNYLQIAAIQNAGIMDGSGQNFNPSNELTRVQMAKILVGAYKLQGSSTKNFTDVPETHWGYEYVSTLAANGITSGYADGRFGLSDKVTRKHFSAFLQRILVKQ